MSRQADGIQTRQCAREAPQKLPLCLGCCLPVAKWTNSFFTRPVFYSKHILTHLSLLLQALELGSKGIRCNAVAPGYINTPSNAGVLEGPEAVAAQEKKVAMGRMGTPGEVADLVAYLFSDEARYVTGSIVEVNGGRT